MRSLDRLTAQSNLRSLSCNSLTTTERALIVAVLPSNFKKTRPENNAVQPDLRYTIK